MHRWSIKLKTYFNEERIAFSTYCAVNIGYTYEKL